MQNNYLSFSKVTMLLLLLVATFLPKSEIQAQCPDTNVFFANEGLPPCGSFGSISLGGGTFANFDVFTGASYTFSTCGSSFNTQITAYDQTGNFLFFNDDNGVHCLGQQASLDWTSTVTGPIRVLINEFSCMSNSTSAILSYRQNDNVTFTSPGTLCMGSGSVTLSGSPVGGTFTGAGVTGTTFDPAVAGVGTHTLTYTVGSCSESADVIVSGAILNVAGTQNPTCNNFSNGKVDISAVGGQPPYAFLWSTGDTLEDLTGVPAGSYTVTVTDNQNCANTISATLTEPTVLTSTVVSSTNATCFGSADGAADLDVSGGTAPYTFFWSNFIFTEDLAGVPAGTYSVLITDSMGCTTTNSVSITQPGEIEITGAASTANCGSGANIEITATGGVNPLTYIWSNGATTEDLVNVAAGTYTVTVTDATGCSATATFTVPVVPDNLLAGFQVSAVCFGAPAQFTNTSTSLSGTLFSFWDFGDGDGSTLTNPTYTYNSPGIYTVKLIVLTNQGCVDSFSSTVEVYALPTVTLTGVTEFCAGDTTTISATPGFDIYLWSTGDTTESILVSAAGFYAVTVIDNNSCSATDSIFVDVLPLPVVTVTADTTVSKGFSVQLEATGGVTYEWFPATDLDDPFSPTPVATPQETTAYTVTVTDADGCTAEATVNVTVVNDLLLFVPNLFTPNGSGKNDYWKIGNIATYQHEIHIFNKWGELVYETTKYKNDWEGTSDGNKLSDGTYYYVINLENGQKIYKGAVTILQ